MLAGTIAYIIDKHFRNNIHLRLPRRLGLQQEFIELKQCSTTKQAQLLLCSAAAAPPFMPSLRIQHKAAIDGGYTDNAPTPKQTTKQKSKTLILLTRHYPNLPTFFQLHNRSYWQPSRKVPVSTWDCTTKATIDKAFQLGLKDAYPVLQPSTLSRLKKYRA